MKIYLAGGVSGNLKPAWSRLTRMEITPSNFVKALKDESFFGRVERSQTHSENYSRVGIPSLEKTIVQHKPFILESFYYADEETERLLPLFGDFLLDSGAFTFIQNSTTETAWDDYIEQYAEFIKRNNVKKYFELDIDNIIGYDKVVEYRKKLEKIVGWQSIPVWHKGRGMNEYLNLADEYPYIAIGGIAIKEIDKTQYPAFTYMIKEAHKRKCKVHGLGFTQLNLLPKYHFDSVDSTAWTSGNRFGYVYKFDGKTMRKIDAPSGKRLADPRKVALNNYIEWIKFQKYAEINL